MRPMRSDPTLSGPVLCIPTPPPETCRKEKSVGKKKGKKTPPKESYES